MNRIQRLQIQGAIRALHEQITEEIEKASDEFRAGNTAEATRLHASAKELIQTVDDLIQKLHLSQFDQ